MNSTSTSPLRPPRALLRSVVFAVPIAVILAVLIWRLWPRQPAPAPRAAVPVRVGRPVTMDLPIEVQALGTVTALNVVDIKVRVDGQLQKVFFEEGQDVHTGQLLAQLDRGPLTAQLHQAEANQRKDQASLDNARLDLLRYTQLSSIGAATSQTLDTAKSQVESLTAAVAADAALVESDRLQLGFTNLAAPFNGRVGLREADLGAIVHPGDTTGVVTVTQMEPISVLFSVPQDLLPSALAGGKPSAQHVTVTASTDTRPLAEGTLSFVDSQVDATTGQIRMRASFENSNRALWPGQLVSVRWLVRTDRQRVAVPSRAIVNTQDGPQLFVVDSNGAAQLRKVHIGAGVDGMTEIRDGVAPADLVIFDGQSRLSSGTTVTPTFTAPAATVDHSS